nr:MAG TPA: hypothetical protein [Caudoviricetes sp.]
MMHALWRAGSLTRLCCSVYFTSPCAVYRRFTTAKLYSLGSLPMRGTA